MTPFVDVTGTPDGPKTSAIAAASAASFSGVEVPWALIWAMSPGDRPASARASFMQTIAPVPPGDGAVMWCASALLAAPSTSPWIVAPRATRGLPLLEHEHGGTLAEDEAVARLVERLARPGRAERGHVGERGDTDAAVGRLGAAGDHRVAHAPGDEPGGVADGVGGRGARGGDRLVRALQPVAHRDGRAGGVGHHHRDEERRDPSFALLQQHADLVLGGLQPTDARGEDRADPVGPSPTAARRGRTPRRRRRWPSARPGRRGVLPWGWRSTAAGPSRSKPSERAPVIPGPLRPSQNASRPMPVGATTP